MNIDHLASRLAAYRFRFVSEKDLQDGIEALLTAEHIPFQRERAISAPDRPDFLVDGNLAVEVKIKGSLAQPLALTATAAELDAQFAECVSSYVTARKSLTEQMEATAAVLAAAKQESAGKAVKAITKSATASTVKDKAAPTNSDPEDGEDDEGGEIAPAPDVAPAAPAADPGNLFA